jgi:hypothetical protein
VRVGWAIPCRYVEVNNNLATIVGGGVDRVWVPEVPPPVPVQLLCAVRIVAGHEELDPPEREQPEHELVSRVHGPSMELVSELRQPFGIGGEGVDPTVEPAVIIPIGVVFQPETEGQHTLEIAVDDRGFSFPLTIVVGPPPLA